MTQHHVISRWTTRLTTRSQKTRLSRQGLEMPPSRKIADFFKRPSFAASIPETPPPNNRKKSDSPAAAETSPLTEPPSSFLEKLESPPSFDDTITRVKQPEWHPVKDEANVETPEQRLQSVDTENSSRRKVMDGKEVVISSDGEETDSIASLESPEDLFAAISGSGSKDVAEEKEFNEDEAKGTRSRRAKKDGKGSKFDASRSSIPEYKNTLDSLVTAAVDDNETEAGVAKLRAAFNKSEQDAAAAVKADSQDNKLHEGMVTSALGDKDDEQGIQRLLDAVRRTEAFDQEKAWSFFTGNATPLPGPEFPRDCVAPGTYMAVLREPDSRERAFHSGIVELALSKRFLPDELVYWIFHSKSRDELRHVYCRVFKNATAERIKSLIRPDDIDQVFQRLGASPKGLAITEPVTPDSPEVSSKGAPNNQAALLSVLGMLRGAASLFANDTRERISMILFRLTFDLSVTRNITLCAELERAITAALESIPENGADGMVHRISTTLFDTIKDTAFQSRLLRHTLPSASWIALLRCRLAVAFLIRNPSPLSEPPQTVLDIKRITRILQHPRFDIKQHKGKGRAEYDYGELGATIALLNIAIDTGWTGLGFPSKEAEKAFIADIDALADRIRKIFTAIEDSGVSHLKRTLAKEGLEALHYRVLYSVRSKPPPKKPLFKEHKSEIEARHKPINSYFRPDRSKKDTQMPIREHENPS